MMSPMTRRPHRDPRSRQAFPPQWSRPAPPSRPEAAKAPPSYAPGQGTGWDAVAKWYDQLVGATGHEQHQQVVIPAVLNLLHPQPGEAVLDVGCGQGVLLPFVVKARARYTGVDASGKLLEFARKRYGAQGIFLDGDARDLSKTPTLAAGTFDAAVMMLAIQDTDPVEGVCRSLAWALKPGGRAVIAMTHPCFRVPRQSGWGWDEGRKLQYRRVDRYLTTLAVPMKAFDGSQGGTTTSFHRPLATYVNGFAAAGLCLERMEELPLGKTRQPGPRGKAEFQANQDIPQFLLLRFMKPQSSGR